MKKLLTSFLITWAFCTQAAMPPSTILNEQGTVGTGSTVTVVPNNQGTTLGGIKTRIETGNTNILINPSFEHISVSTGWTITNATASVSTTTQVDGKQAMSLALSGIMSVQQLSTVNAANSIGLQGMASKYVKTSLSDVSVCSIVNSAEDKCVIVTGDSAWHLIQIPFIMGATNNGIKVKTTSSTSGAVFIDNAFVGLSSPFASNTNISNWTSYTPTFIGFGTPTAVEFQYRQVGGNYEIRGKFTSGVPTAVEARVSLPNSATSAGTSIIPSLSVSGSGYFNSNEYSTVASLIEPSVSYVTFGLQSNIQNALTKATGSQFMISGRTFFFFASVPIAGLEQGSKTYAQSSQDIPYQPCTFSTLAWSSVGTITNNLFCARKNENLLIKGKWTTGSPITASAFNMPLPTNFGTIAIASSVGTSQIFGNTYRETVSAGSNYVLHGSGGGTVLFASPPLYNAATNPITQANGSTIFSASEIQNIAEVKIPIQGWQDYGVIVGSFAGIEKCANDYECTDTFSAFIASGTGVVSNENIDWINGNCSVSAATYTCNFNTNLKDGVSGLGVAPNCTVGINGGAGTFRVPRTLSSTTQVIFSVLNSAASTADADITVNCSKGGSDYKPKTAKVASSIGVPTVPGITTQAIDTFSVSYGTTNATTVCSASPCSYLNQIGSALLSITRSGVGAYIINLSKTYSNLKCVLNAYNGAGTPASTLKPIECSNCSSTGFTTAFTNTTATNDTAGTLYCQGSY